MKSENTTITLFLIVTVLGTLVNGCTIVGFGIGLRADHRNAHRDINATWQAPDSIPRGKRVEITLVNGTRLSGKYMGSSLRPIDEYATELAQVRDRMNLAIAIPTFGDTLSVTRITGARTTLRFEGFVPRGMLTLGSNRMHGNRPFRSEISLADIRELSGQHEEAYSVPAIDTLLRQRKLPLRDLVLLGTLGDPQAIPLQQVESLHAYPTRSHHWLTGLLFGIAIDGAFIYGISTAIANTHWNVMSGGS